VRGRARARLACAAAVLAATPAARADEPPRFELAPGERIVVVGNTFAERMALSGAFDALAHAAHPEHRLVIRHVPWSADEVAVRPRERNVPTMEDHLEALDASVVVMCFGMSESFAGAEGLPAFERDLGALVAAVGEAGAEGTPPRRLILVSPIAHEDLGPPWPTGPALRERNRVLAAYVEAMRRVAGSADVRFVDLFAVTAAREEGAAPLTSNGIHPGEHGCIEMAGAVGRQLGWIDDAAVADAGEADAAARLRRLCFDKHYHVRLLYRPTNTEYVWGRRAEPFGVVNFPPEMAQLERMVEAREAAIWDMDLPSPAAAVAVPPPGPAVWEQVPSSHDFAEDEWSPPPVEAKGTETSLGDLDILPPEQFIRSFTLPDGYVIECFASEQEIRDLQNPLAMTFDDRGRLWVLCAPTYPHLMPGEAPRCRLIVLEDTDGDGRADDSTTFADRLYVPTGFAIDTDAVYVAQSPDLWKLTDTDGDGRADRREIVASGFGMPDSHHQLSAFEWDPNGGIVMHEGVFTKSNVETPYGTRRTDGAATWRFDPRTGRMDVLSHCNFANPWGHVFDDFGQSVLADASGGDNYSFSHVITVYEYPGKPKRVGRLLHRGRPTAGCELVASRHFPEDVQDSFLVNQSIGFHGTRWDRIMPDGSAWKAERMPQDILESSDTNFRPVAMEIGPDGTLYILDWCNPLIGHMQYSVRDPRRDHDHGRVWRIRHESRPLVEPPDVAGAAVPALLELLRLPERNTRQLARRRLQTAPPSEVFPELAKWTASLDPADPLHDRLVLESLWIHQAHGRVDVELLERVAMLPDARVRAGAIRVVRHWLQQEQVDRAIALPLLARAVDDEDMRVRLEGVVACGFVPDVAAASVAAEAATRPMDDGLRIALQETLAYLARFGEPSGAVARRLRLERSSAAELAAVELDEIAAEVVLTRADQPMPRRAEALALLAGDDPTARVERLVAAVRTAPRPEAALDAAAPLLVEMPEAQLLAANDQLAAAAAPGGDRSVRTLALAGLLRAGTADEAVIADDPALLTAATARLAPGEAPDAAIVRLRAAVEDGAVAPIPAIAQVGRHWADEEALFTWLAGLVEPVERRPLSRFDDGHEVAMAALRTMNGLPDERWPAGYERFRTEPVPTEHMELGREVYFDEINGCVRCHGKDGVGEEGFPPLDRSPWVLGRPERAAGIVVHGLNGEIRLRDGRTFASTMEPLGAILSDEQIAAALTFVRRSWGNFAAPVTTAQVAQARRLAPRGGMWDAAALDRMYPLGQDRILPVPEALRVASRGGMTFGVFLMALGIQLVPALIIVGIILLVVFLGQRTRR
jgi:mono/diheme cytochrome c family protein